MVSTKRKLSIQTFVIVMLVLACLITAGAYTYAWFTDSKTGSGSISFGKVAIAVKENTTDITTGTLDASNLMPGDEILAQDITVQLQTGSQNCYLKLTLAFANNGCDTDFVTTLSALFEASAIGVSGTHGWVASTDHSGSFYYVGAGSTPAAFTSTTAVVLLDVDAFVLPTSTTQATGQAQATGSVTMTVTVSAIQTANITGTVDALDDLTF